MYSHHTEALVFEPGFHLCRLGLIREHSRASSLLRKCNDDEVIRLKC